MRSYLALTISRNFSGLMSQRSWEGAGAALFAAVVDGIPNCNSKMSCAAVCVESVGSRNVSAPADWIIPLTRWKRFPITAPATPWRGIGIEGIAIHEFVAGSYASTARNAPTSSVVVTSPPAT